MIGKSSNNSSNDWKTPAMALLLAVFALTLFWPATGYDFIQLDDNKYVRDNPHVNTGWSAENVRWAFTTAHEQWYLPMLWLSFMTDVSWFGNHPSVYHRTNILLHAVNVALLFLVLFRMTGSLWRSALVAALFAAHPTRVEAVAWVTARKDTLSGLFFMLGLWAYASYATRPERAKMIWVALCLVLGLLSKAILVVLPMCLLLLDIWPLRRAGLLWGRGSWSTTWRPLLMEKIPLFAVAALFVVITLSTHETGRGDFANVPLIDRLTFISPNVWPYLKLVFAPVNLAMVYPERDYLDWARFAFTSAGLFGVTAVCLWGVRRYPYLLVGWLWFLVALAPIVRGVRLGLASHADRFTYLPLIGLAMAFVWFVADVVPRRRWRVPVLAACAVALLIGCVAGTRAYLPYWEDSETLFLATMARTKNNYLVLVNLASVYNEQNRTDDEISALQRALDINPRSTVSHVGMAAALRQRGQLDEADLHIRLAQAHVQPREWQVHLKIAEHLALRGQFDEAIPHFHQVLQVDPGYIDARHNIGMCHALAGRNREALPYFSAVLEVAPGYLNARVGRAATLSALGRYEEALFDARVAGRQDMVENIQAKMRADE